MRSHWIDGRWIATDWLRALDEVAGGTHMFGMLMCREEQRSRIADGRTRLSFRCTLIKGGSPQFILFKRYRIIRYDASSGRRKSFNSKLKLAKRHATAVLSALARTE